MKIKLLTGLLFAVATAFPAAAQSSACVGCAAAPNPVSPNCPSGLLWTAQSTGVFTCLAPPPSQPTGGGPQGGNPGGGASSNDPIALCASSAAAQGVTLNPNSITQVSPFTKNGQAATLRGFTGTGPEWSENGTSGNLWQIFCANFDATGQFIPGGSQPGPFSVQPFDTGCPGCGGGT